MSFYRIYRPEVIEEIDNPKVVEKLLSLLTKDVSSLPHAYLFTGPRGTGKTTAARIVAKIFNCTNPTKNGPCGKCDMCNSIAAGNNLDVLEIDAASNRGIDEMRELRERISLAPSGAKYKVYIIDEVHMLTTEAFNALLKTLEEPPLHAVFVLATTDPQKVPETIRSRCTIFTFDRAGRHEIKHALERIVSREKLKIDDDAMTLLTGLADGSFRDAVKLLEQVSLAGSHISSENILKFLPASSDAVLAKLFDSLREGNTQAALTIVNSLVNEGKDIKYFLTDVLGKCHQLLLQEVSDPSGVWTIADLKFLISLLTQSYTEMRVSPIPQLPLELAVVEFCQAKETRDKRPASPAGRQVTSKNEDNKFSDDIKDQQTSENGSIDLQKLTDHWPDIIESMKPFNHSIAGVLRSARPKAVDHGIVTLEAFYKFHQEKLGEIKTRETLAEVLRKLFGERVKVEVVLGKK